MERMGKRAERQAAWWYRLRGYRVLAENAWVAGYELDLVVRRGRQLVFCEVKAKTGDAFGAPVDMVSDEKQRRGRRAASALVGGEPAAGGPFPFFGGVNRPPRRPRPAGRGFFPPPPKNA